ncbi:fumarylacetoacetate hydrolase family protein [Enterovirga rhinocerotis]|uniref:2-keto-4-pentenoate hydratase/2-oxohepta-3-ene-1,7-dioic acid hydratase in catechol pathway n=1 Tax=Enterovirga rhinocerotis TaxID=1339210 RepID=A0A4R7BXV7_9HYPH|nr:fumarylacetoacetate hydrolase family protein [Enterovirga rhinocerotis]TDR90431.1 2-keto-4-pentenoate hydratase/2-oxohepta-3-ene-1,7-dioic acid hydratase in catechol pathway [Enterovirga rhinocerotis]
MRFSSIRTTAGDTLAVRLEDGLHDLRAIDPSLPDGVGALVAGGPDLMARAGQAAKDATAASRLDEASLSYRPLIERPGKIICIGRNYAAHAREGGAEPLAYPDVFMRSASSLVAHGEPLVRPRASDKFDYEGELVFVVGRKARHVRAADAYGIIAGYSLFNEGSLRDYQRKATQWTMGKNFDGTGAFGPDLVTPDELPEGADGLRLTTVLNGQVMQDGNTHDFIFPVARVIEILTEAMTLEPGDVVVTGTPAGVGYARNPPVFMKPGDAVEVTIEKVGTLRNTVRDEA